MSDDLQQRVYPEDERLREVQEDPDRRMTRDQWEREESLARQASHKRHDSVQHDREVQQEFDAKRSRNTVIGQTPAVDRPWHPDSAADFRHWLTCRIAHMKSRQKPRQNNASRRSPK